MSEEKDGYVVKSFSATLMQGMNIENVETKKFPRCPLCGARMFPSLLSVDYGIHIRGGPNDDKTTVRSIGEETIWSCEFMCKSTTIHERKVDAIIL